MTSLIKCRSSFLLLFSVVCDSQLHYTVSFFHALLLVVIIKIAEMAGDALCLWRSVRNWIALKLGSLLLSNRSLFCSLNRVNGRLFTECQQDAQAYRSRCDRIRISSLWFLGPINSQPCLLFWLIKYFSMERLATFRRSRREILDAFNSLESRTSRADISKDGRRSSWSHHQAWTC